MFKSWLMCGALGIAVVTSSHVAPLQAKTVTKTTTTTAAKTPRLEMNRFIAAIKARRVETMKNLVSPSKGLEITGIEVRNDYADYLKDPKKTWANEMLFTVDAKSKQFQAAREFPKIRWVWAGDKFVPSKNGKNWKKSEVWVKWQLEKGAWKIVEVGTPYVGGDVG